MTKFDFYYSLPFWGAFLTIALVTRLFDRKAKTRTLVLLIASSLMILAIPRFSLVDYIAVLALALLTFLCGFALGGDALLKASGSRKVVAGWGIAAVLLFLAFFKYHFIQDLIRGVRPEEPSGHLFLIGVSYFSFKMIHFVVEAYRRKIVKPDLWCYLDYILFFPSFISGPINRYEPFASQLAVPPRFTLRQDLKIGLERIVHGLFKKFVLVQILYPHILVRPTGDFAPLTFGKIAIGLYAYALYFYFDFSAYSDLAIGGARILGLELPENFNRPFLKKNIRELWLNWHMSLTSWLVDYVYWPLVRKLRGFDFFRPRPVLLSNIGMIITFVACGIWHGETFNFIIWGAYHGLGISIVNIYQREKRKTRSPLLQRYFASRISVLAGTFATFNFFVWGLVFFAYDFQALKALVSRLWTGV